MAGKRAGGLAAAKTNIDRYGPDFYAKIGALGGKVAPGPFYRDRELAKRAGAIGGTVSRRKPAR